MAASIAPFEEDFLRITADIVWCTLTTVDRHGRPRSRVVHPRFTIADKQQVGWLLTGRTPVKSSHPAQPARLVLVPGAPIRNVVYADRVATWVEDLETRRSVDELFRSTPPPLGYNPVEFGLGDPDDTFTPLRLDPWRVQVLRLAGVEREPLAPHQDGRRSILTALRRPAQHEDGGRVHHAGGPELAAAREALRVSSRWLDTTWS